ncbi:CYTH domain-containing protein [Streptomyces sp. NPDC002536]
MPVEIEMRARFDEATRDRLIARLEKEGSDLGVDDKQIYFYTFPDKLLKVTDNITAGSAKITLKHSKIGAGAAFPETEIAIARADVPKAVEIFAALGFAPLMHGAFNQRHNYRLRGVEIAVKWSEAWGHHAELEVLLGDEAGPAARQEAAERITGVAKELGLELMSEQELADFTTVFERKQAARNAASTKALPQN